MAAGRGSGFNAPLTAIAFAKRRIEDATEGVHCWARVCGGVAGGGVGAQRHGYGVDLWLSMIRDSDFTTVTQSFRLGAMRKRRSLSVCCECERRCSLSPRFSVPPGMFWGGSSPSCTLRPRRTLPAFADEVYSFYNSCRRSFVIFYQQAVFKRGFNEPS